MKKVTIVEKISLASANKMLS